ncbi:MAG: immunoglobulin domain-containing protein [Bacteroidales bacterium]|nr:immunoglobulin domain-containing protein [Bacteroidales bacterium]
MVFRRNPYNGTGTICQRNGLSKILPTTQFALVQSTPVINTQPVGATICEGQSHTFTVSATGGSLHYQWFHKNTSNLVGTDDNTFTLSTTSLSDSGEYFCIVSDGLDTVYSSKAKLLIRDFSVAPTSATADRTNVCPGDGDIVLSYSGGTLGSGAFAKWYTSSNFLDGDSIKRILGPLTISAPTVSTTYYVRYEGCNLTSSASVLVNVNSDATITLGSNPSVLQWLNLGRFNLFGNNGKS